ncbi:MULTISPECIES: 7-carboxy-7-deazaguanine synthase QueE [Bacillaceae]|uniref:7-carboxy-7-deazaguanine synthase n=1 Tax=Evansella alkalicola TaxID=745819 RepID=A0ABS6JUG7_9BACI|nr:7-carboxy-7-deazaguanine synthase QueE [Litchfieldia alkalitelluris]MBU9720882.1 7-carboxy-7-deazaguanine synthase QueE [Bacillus alkalicola]
MSKPIPVLEIFGPTIQGEGMVIGRKTMFVRTAGCDYSCDWCDSAFTWDGTGKPDLMSAEKIWSVLSDIGEDHFSHVTISGGNPALLPQLSNLIQILKDNRIRIGVETQGSRWQDWLLHVDDLTISPKPPSSKMNTDLDVLDQIIGNLVDGGRLKNISLKIVIFDEEDLEYAKQVHQRYSKVNLYLQVGNDDVTTVEDDVLTRHLLQRYEWLINQVTANCDWNDVRVLPQLHTLVWGNKRGV